MKNLDPIFAQALAPFAPPAVTEKHEQSGSGGVYTFTGMDADAVYAEALKTKDSLGPFRSPFVIGRFIDSETGECSVELRYYGLD